MNSTDAAFQCDLETEHRGEITGCDSHETWIQRVDGLWGGTPGAGGNAAGWGAGERGLRARPGLDRAPGVGGRHMRGADLCQRVSQEPWAARGDGGLGDVTAPL